MSLKRVLSLIGIFVALLCALRAAGSPKASLMLHVTDENGQPIEGAEAGAMFEAAGLIGSNVSSSKEEGKTDRDGKCVVSAGTANGYVSYGATMPGYYPTMNLKWKFERSDAGRWLPWNPTAEIVLRRIGKPTELYAQSVVIYVPVLGEFVGYDLECADWVEPYGVGVHSDLRFKAARRFVSRYDFDCSVEVQFANDGDGLVRYPVSGPKGRGSLLRMPAVAPAAGYGAKLCLERGRARANAYTNVRDDMNYYLRLRTLLDREGRVASAIYGKVYGDFDIDPINSKTCAILFTYFLNPAVNDRNVELDPERNLFKGLRGRSVVREP